jgi:serine/threonine-protein phosphatase Stp1
MPNRVLRLTSAARSESGSVRDTNDDSFIERSDLGLWAVSDGMGGHAHGQWASRKIIEALASVTGAGDLDADARAVTKAIRAANTEIYARVASDGRPLGATVVAMLCKEGRLSIQWAGDSRLYRIRDSNLEQLTHDHTQVQELVDAGRMEPERAKNHLFSHVLARAVGVQPELELAVRDADAQLGDLYLLCSDGLHGVVSDPEILAATPKKSPLAICDALIDLCHQRGAPDNVTVIAVACEARVDGAG